MKVHLFCFYALSLFLLITACQSENSNQGTKKSSDASKSSDTEPVKPAFYAMPTLDENNAKEHLSKYGEVNTEKNVLLKTEFGDIKIELYEDTPLHRANFVYLAKKGFFNGVPFYRIMKNFMIQAGAGNFPQRDAVKSKIGNYSIPNEYKTEKYFHSRGAIAMTKPEKLKPGQGSTPYDFYIVQGQKYTDGQLNIISQRDNIQFSAAQRQTYTTIGGTPELDSKHTVFGKVIEGMDIVDKIAALEVRPEDQAPSKLVGIKVEIY